ncbi:MAG: hypothetical protein K1X81_07935 [Bacteroidia bacterium]|nr:hypothetical protein [Bacteroidia bacterium]
MNHIPVIISIAFTALVAVSLLTTVLVFRPFYLKSTSKRKAFPLLLLGSILIVQSILTMSGFFVQTIHQIPPPMVIPIILLFITIIYLVFGYEPLRNIQPQHAIKLAYLQMFRLPLELIFIWLLSHHSIPTEMTFEGRNPDILIGLSAPVVALAVQKNWLPVKFLIVWNLIGLGFLINIVTVAILCLPTPFRFFFESVPNEFVLYFPFNLVPSALVMLALFLHLLSLKILFRK